MRTLVTCAAVLALFIGLGAPSTAHAEDPQPGPKVNGAWLYEIRIVRVDPKAAADSEAGSPFPELSDTTIDLPWAAVLARLKERGRTTVLMDTRMSAETGIKTEVSDERITPIVALNFQDRNNEQYRAQPIKEGCSFEQTTATQMTYRLQVRGTATPPVSMKPTAQYLVQWQGTHPRLAGRTLVLEHRQQVDVATEPQGAGRAEELRQKQDDLNRARARIASGATRLEDIEARMAQAKREANTTSRHDVKKAREDELERLAKERDELARDVHMHRDQVREMARALQVARGAAGNRGARTQRSIEHYAFITGRYVAKK